MLNSKGIALKRGLTYYQNQYNLQDSQYKSKKDYKKVLKYVTDMDKVFVAAANDMLTFTMSQNPKLVDVDNTSKTNRNKKRFITFTYRMYILDSLLSNFSIRIIAIV